MAVDLQYRQCHGTRLHVATLMKHGKEIAQSRNRVGTRSRGCGWNDQTMHAECAVVKELGDISQLRGCTLIVVQIGKDNNLKLSKPCHACEKFLHKCIKHYGLRKVVYST
jgi:hypothetical protein